MRSALDLAHSATFFRLSAVDVLLLWLFFGRDCRLGYARPWLHVIKRKDIDHVCVLLELFW